MFCFGKDLVAKFKNNQIVTLLARICQWFEYGGDPNTNHELVRYLNGLKLSDGKSSPLADWLFRPPLIKFSSVFEWWVWILNFTGHFACCVKIQFPNCSVIRIHTVFG